MHFVKYFFNKMMSDDKKTCSMINIELLLVNNSVVNCVFYISGGSPARQPDSDMSRAIVRPSPSTETVAGSLSWQGKSVGIQCDAVVTRSIFSQILTKDTA